MRSLLLGSLALAATACGGQAVDCRGALCELQPDPSLQRPQSEQNADEPELLPEEPPNGADRFDPPRPSRPLNPGPVIDDAPAPRAPDDPLELERTSDGICSNSTLQVQVTVLNQAQLNQLEGCTGINGGLTISGFDGADLSPLSQVLTINGGLHLGGPRLNEEVPRGILSSLDGLRALTFVHDSLALEDLSVSSLDALSSLRVINRPGEVGESGTSLLVRRCDQLVDLSGLGGMEDLQFLVVEENENLVSLGGLTPRPAIRSLTLVDNPRLVELGSPPIATSVRRKLTISGTGFTDLTAFSTLETALNIVIEDNPFLETLTGLEGLERFDELLVARNPSLVSMTEFPNIDRMKELIISGNPVLVEGPGFPAAIDLASSRADISIRDNPQLESLNGFANLQTVRTLSILSNASLEQLDLGALKRVVRNLDVTCNASLPPDQVAPLSGVQARENTLTGNQGNSAACLD